jgi:hypothetical protein
MRKEMLFCAVDRVEIWLSDIDNARPNMCFAAVQDGCLQLRRALRWSKAKTGGREGSIVVFKSWLFPSEEI